MGKSVKLKDLMNNPAYKRVSGDEESLEREVFVAEINRPGLNLPASLNIVILEELFY